MYPLGPGVGNWSVLPLGISLPLDPPPSLSKVGPLLTVGKELSSLLCELLLSYAIFPTLGGMYPLGPGCGDGENWFLGMV